MEHLHSKESEFKILTFALVNHMTIEMVDGIMAQMYGHPTPEITKERAMKWAKKNMPDKLCLISEFIELVNDCFYKDTKHHENN